MTKRPEQPEEPQRGFDPDTLDFSTPPRPGSKPVPMMSLSEIRRATGSPSSDRNRPKRSAWGRYRSAVRNGAWEYATIVERDGRLLTIETWRVSGDDYERLHLKRAGGRNAIPLDRPLPIAVAMCREHDALAVGPIELDERGPERARKMTDPIAPVRLLGVDIVTIMTAVAVESGSSE